MDSLGILTFYTVRTCSLQFNTWMGRFALAQKSNILLFEIQAIAIDSFSGLKMAAILVAIVAFGLVFLEIPILVYTLFFPHLLYSSLTTSLYFFCWQSWLDSLHKPGRQRSCWLASLQYNETPDSKSIPKLNLLIVLKSAILSQNLQLAQLFYYTIVIWQPLRWVLTLRYWLKLAGLSHVFALEMLGSVKLCLILTRPVTSLA